MEGTLFSGVSMTQKQLETDASVYLLGIGVITSLLQTVIQLASVMITRVHHHKKTGKS